MKNKLLASMLRFVPQKSLSKVMGQLVKSTISRPFIPFYARLYRISTDEMEKPVRAYPNLTAFFTRKLRAGVRVMDEKKDVVVSPVDGTVSSFGTIQKDTLIQAKGISYALFDLLGSSEKAKRYENGSYITIYLSPKDYHRIHVPFDGVVTSSTYIPGRLYPVNRIGVQGVEGLFTKNERMISYLHTKAGEMALVKVGAFIVGSVQVNYPLRAINRAKKEVEAEFFSQPHPYQKGQELGYFEFGSTVILLFEKNHVALNPSLQKDQAIKLGEAIAQKVDV